MLKKSTLILFLFFYCSIYSQDYYANFLELYQKNYDVKKIKEFLADWKEKAPNDAQFYVAGFNFYFNQSKKELLHLDSNTEKKENLVLKDSLDKVAGYLYSENHINDSLFAISQKFLDDGLQIHPKRLDMQFGKIYALGEAKKYNEFTNQILYVIAISRRTNLDWLWVKNKPLEDKVNFFKSSIQDYQNTLFNDKEDANMKKIAIEMANYFPEDEIVLSTLGTCYLVENNLKEALVIFQKANTINPNDVIILNNIAQTYARMNDIENAKKYYQEMISKGDEETKKYAEEKLKKLN